MLHTTLTSIIVMSLFLVGCSSAAPEVEMYAVHEVSVEASTCNGNPYLEIEAAAAITRPDGETWRLPLFWDGDTTWRLRLSPDTKGRWSYKIESTDPNLNRVTGSFVCVPSGRAGGLRVMDSSPSHFARQNGDPVWFMGDTAWGYFTGDEDEQHNREQAHYYAKVRAGQGFNVIHSMMMSEQGVGNSGGPPFYSMRDQTINPGYWQEVDERLRFANEQGLTVGMAIAWGDKRGEPYAWGQFPNLEARKRYARYMAARYSAYGVYFLISGEWNFEVRARKDTMTADEVFDEFVAIGDALDDAEPHGRLIGIHPWSAYGGVREFAGAKWMSFGDYQQNYNDLHERVLFSRRLPEPVVNSEYGYHLRDQDGDGKPDKSNSFSVADMRFASWDIVMGGGYLVTGFGTTYFAGYRDPGPFDVDAAKNDDWEAQIVHIKRFFEGLEWWKLIPADELVSAPAARGKDRLNVATENGRKQTRLQPPALTYWAMEIPGDVYVLYARGMRRPLTLTIDARAGKFQARQFNPRTGEFQNLTAQVEERWQRTNIFNYTPPDDQDWVVLLERTGSR